MDVGGWKWSHEVGGGEGCMTRLAVIRVFGRLIGETRVRAHAPLRTREHVIM